MTKLTLEKRFSMNIIPQMKLFEEEEFENLGDLERQQQVLSTLDDGN